MIDSIYLALSGMLGHERGLNVISNNVTNMNTLAFRGSTVNFADVFVGSAPNGLGQGAGGGRRGIGGGVDASRTQVDFRAGEPQNTGGELDLALQGEGFFIVQDEQGQVRYTRGGAFDLVDDELVLRGQKVKVLTRNASGALVPVSVRELRDNPAKATTTVRFENTLSSSDPEHVIDSLTIFDSRGVKRTLRITFTRVTEQTLPPQVVPPGVTRWTIAVSENGRALNFGDEHVDFNGLSAVADDVPLSLPLEGAATALVTFNFREVDNLNLGGGPRSPAQSTLSVKDQDGLAPGTITGRTFDENGVLKLTYSNGEKADGPKLALAQITDQDGLVQVGESLLEYRGVQAVEIRAAGADLRVQARVLEGSNVDLTTQFSQLILMQRGYQASSQVLSTANDMLQELFDLRGRR